MDSAETQHNTIVEKAVFAMWKEFETAHDKLISNVINQVKGEMNLSTESIQAVKALAIDRLSPLLADKSQEFADYRLSF